MNEHDNKYPEFARPYEPVKGGKKHKGLTWNPLPLIVAAFLLLLLPNVVKPTEEIPAGPSVIDVPGWTLHAQTGGKDTLYTVPHPEPGVLPRPSESPTPVPRPVRPAPSPTPTPLTNIYYPATPTSTPSTPVQPAEDRVVVKIVGNTDTFSYDGEEHGVEWFEYTASLNGKELDPTLFEVELLDLDKGYVGAIEPGTYYMGLTASDFSVTSSQYSKISVQVQDGWVKIIDTNVPVTVTITGNTATYTYDGTSHQVSGYTYTATSSEGDLVSEDFTVELTGTAAASGTDVGKYPMMGLVAELSASDFTVTSDTYTNITVNFTNGWLEITPADLTVTITGHTRTEQYTGDTYTVEGYDVSIPAGAFFEETDIAFSGTAQASGSEAGRYTMGLTPGNFSSTNGNYNVTFNVTDGWLEITSATADHTPPSVSLGSGISALPENNGMHFYVAFRINAWNDLADGTMTATLYTSADGGSTYTAVADSTKTIEGSSGATDAQVDAVLPGTVAVYKGKIVLEYTYSDGTTGSAELGPINLHTDSFGYINTGFGNQGWEYDINGNLSVDVVIDDTKVDPNTVDFEYATFKVNGNSVSNPAINRYTGTDGKQHIQVGVMTTISGEASVSCTIYLNSTDSEGSPWMTTLSHSGTVNN
ncbi:MAG: hypothetical protein IJJ29_06010 [Solobacterium sp.]|nr:hypothetical protein [Solobacterium sp.]